MNENLMLPYFCQVDHHSYFLVLNERQELCLHTSSIQGEWEQGEVILPHCRRFAAALDANECLHVIAANGQNKFTYFKITDNLVSEHDFIVKESSSYFLISFSTSGSGYFLCGDDTNAGKLMGCKFSLASGWKEDQLLLGKSHLRPLCLSLDRSDGLHLVLYDLANGSLLYYCRVQANQRWTNPAQLDSALQMSTPPALWMDASQSVHIAWYVPRNNTVCYRIKKAGGWPQGGWQPEHYVPMDTVPRIISFQVDNESIKLWCFGADSKINIFTQQNGDWQKSQLETDFRLPVRHGIRGGELYNLAEAVPTDNWYYRPVLTKPREAVDDNKDEQEENLVGQIIQLMEEKRSLKALLQKKEESLAQYRLMLERTHDTISMQRSDWKTSSTKTQEKLRNTQEELQRVEIENKSLKERVEQLLKKLSALEITNKEVRTENFSLHLKVSQYQQQETETKSALRKLEEELQSKKGVWQTISSAFHKKG